MAQKFILTDLLFSQGFGTRRICAGLVQQGLVQRTPRGRMLTGAAYGHLGLNAPPRDPAQAALFSDDAE